MARVGWKELSCGITRFLFPHSRYPEGARRKPPRILAVVPAGPDRRVLQALARDAGWALTLSETPIFTLACQADVPPLIIYDRCLSPDHWRDIVRVLAQKSPRPYVILLSSNSDANLWDELQRVGGCDILRTPVNRDNLLWALKRAWLLWHNQQHIRLPSPQKG